MKYKLILLLTMAFMLLGLTACKDNGKTDPPPIGDEVNLTVAPEAITLYTYQSQALSASVQDAVWSSSDASVARVDSATGVVTGISEGMATITATKGEHTASCRVSVVDDYNMPVLELSNRYVALNKDGEYGVSARVTIRGEQLGGVRYSWSVAGDDGVASVLADGNASSAVIKGINYGSTLIKVEAVTDNCALTSFIDVDVKNVTVWFDVSGVIRNEGEYKVNLYALNDGALKNDVTPVINVYNGENQVSAPTFAWESEDPGIATVSQDGLIKAVKPGSTVVYATYGSDRVFFKVNVLYAQKDISDRIDIELGRSEADISASTVELAIPSEVNDTVESVTVQGKELLVSQTASSFVIDKSKLPTEMGHHDITIRTCNAIYTAEGMICTMVIYNADDLDSFGAVAKRMSENKFTWDGYFALGNDIIYNSASVSESNWRSYQSFISVPKINSAGGTPWNYSDDVGFKGVFDGCGYNIDGFMTSIQSSNDRGGFIGILNIKGTIKDLSFTNAVHKGRGGFLTTLAAGRIDNIFIHAQKQYISQAPSSPASYHNSFLVAGDSKYMTDINNCILLIEEYVGTRDDLAYASSIGTFWVDNGSLDNVYAIGGTGKAINKLNDTDPSYRPLGIKDVYGSYVNVTDFLNAEIDLKDFSQGFWNLECGLPFAHSAAAFIDPNMLFEVSETSVLKGSSVALTTDALTFVNVDATSNKLGIKIEGNSLMVPTLSSIPTGHIVTLTARSAFDASLEKTVQIKVTGEMKAIALPAIVADMYHLNGSGEVELNGTTIDIDLSAYKNEITANTVTAKIGSTAFASAIYNADSGILSLSKDSVGTIYGEQMITVSFKQTDDSGDIIAHTEVTAPITVYSMIISDKADLDAFGSVAKLYSANAFTWDGYFVLGNNITYNDTSADEETWSEYQSFISVSMINRDGGDAWGYAASVGFAGIFDGHGYNIDGFMTGKTWPNDRGGFIGILNAKGVIKNLSFTNAVHKGLGGFLTTMSGGKIENVFIHARKQYITQSTSYPGSYLNGFLVGYDSKYMLDIDNCIVMVDECVSTNATDKDYASTLGTVWLDNGSLKNVYAIGGMNKAVISLNYDGYPSLGIPDVIGSYESMEAFVSAGLNLDSFDTDFWDLSTGVPVSLSGKDLIN